MSCRGRLNLGEKFNRRGSQDAPSVIGEPPASFGQAADSVVLLGHQLTGRAPFKYPANNALPGGGRRLAEVSRGLTL